MVLLLFYYITKKISLIFILKIVSQKKRPIHGLIFLFKWIGNTEIDGTFVTDQEKLDDIFFLKQVIDFL